MFELVITLCLSAGAGCAEEISPRTADLATCELAGKFMSALVRIEAARQGIDAEISWTCRKRGVAL